MGLNKQQGNMYEFVTHTWNPLGGECMHDCVYCYAKMGRASRIPKYKSELRLIERELIPLGKSKAIFVCSMNDLFQKDVDDETIIAILGHCMRYPENTYLFQSKNPGRFVDFDFPERAILCTTIETDKYPEGVMEDSPVLPPASRLNGMLEAKEKFRDSVVYSVTIEPIMKFNLDALVAWMKELEPRWVSIGADSKGCNLPEPSREQVQALVDELQEFTQVVIKKNLRRIK